MRCIVRWCRLTVLVVLTAGAADGLLAADGDGGTLQPVLIPAGVAGPAGTPQAIVGTVANASGGIDAVNLEDGTLFWSTKDASRPLIVYQNRLAALSGSRVVVLDLSEKGKELSESDELPLTGSLTPKPGTVQLSVSGRLDQGDLIVTWTGSGYTPSGPTFGPMIIQDMIRQAAGSARVNLAKGTVEKLAAPAVPKGPYDTPWAAIREPKVVGNTAYSLTPEGAGDGKQKLVLKRSDVKTGKDAEPVTLREGANLIWRVSLDGRHVFVCQSQGDTDWTVFDLETGEKVAVLPNAGMQSMRVIGPRVIFLAAGALKGKLWGERVQEQVLKAMDLKTGKVVWERQVEGIKFLPPLE